ncbi:MAG: hypothetical protein V7746_19675 [Halioglobus sp.]
MSFVTAIGTVLGKYARQPDQRVGYVHCTDNKVDSNAMGGALLGGVIGAA